jgi:Na+/melibiose symporter-like transporter
VAGLLGLNGVALLDAASFLIAAMLIALIAVDARVVKGSTASDLLANPWIKVWREWLAGLRLVKQERNVYGVFMSLAITSLGEGVFGVLFVVFANKILHGGALQTGWLMGAQAVGGLVGGMFIGYVTRKVSPAHLIGFGAIVFGFIDLVIFNYPRFYPAFTIALILLLLLRASAVRLTQPTGQEALQTKSD